MFIDYVERINDDRYDTWVCIKPKCGIDYNIEQAKQIEKEILEYVNNCKTEDFFNEHTGETKYKYGKPICECGDDMENKEHWMLGNDDIEFMDRWDWN